MAYEVVNSQWPEGTNKGRDLKPTAEEAIAAVRALWRFALKRRCPYQVKATSGRRRGGIRRGVWTINPDRWGGGWHEVVHHVSHVCAWKLYPNAKGHGHQHAHLEREMIAHVVAKGWHLGALKRPEKPKPVVDPKAVRYARTLASIERWQAKKRRAENALKKLNRTRKYYERKAAA